jgi:SAM-dependent methyltransferase
LSCGALIADASHATHDYRQYDYTRLGGGESAPHTEQSLEIGFGRDSQANYLLKRFEEAFGDRLHHPFKLLDVGCGPADFLAALKSRYPQCDVSGIDPSQINVQNAWKRHNIQLRQGFWEDALDGSYDAISIFGNLMLHKNPLSSLRVAYGRLTDGGLLLFDFKNPYSATRTLLRAAKPFLPNNRLTCRLYRQAFHGMPWGLPVKLAEQWLREVGFDVVAINQLSGRNAALSGKPSMLLKASSIVDRLARRQPWIEFVARKPARKAVAKTNSAA